MAIKTVEKLKTLNSDALVKDICELIESSKKSIASSINYALTILYWNIGNRIHKDILSESRAEYGSAIVATLSRQLTVNYGKGFTEKNLRKMIQFAEAYPNKEATVDLSKFLSWSHFVILITIKDELQRDFYTQMCRLERWNVRTLKTKINSMLFERTALAKHPEKIARSEIENLKKSDCLTPELIFQDPYVLEFLGLDDHYLEKDLEDAIMRDLEQFLLEIGTGFTFLARQKRITIDGENFFLDLLFFHRDLKRLVAIELKLGNFKPEHKGQMELYLKWLDRYERRPGEEPPIGLILCAGKKQERIELLEVNQSGIHVSEYLTALPPKKILEEKLQRAVSAARKRFEL